MNNKARYILLVIHKTDILHSLHNKAMPKVGPRNNNHLFTARPVYGAHSATTKIMPIIHTSVHISPHLRKREKYSLRLEDVPIVPGRNIKVFSALGTFLAISTQVRDTTLGCAMARTLGMIPHDNYSIRVSPTTVKVILET